MFGILLVSAGIALAQEGPAAAPDSLSDVFSTDASVQPLAASTATSGFQYTVAHFPFGGGWSTTVMAANSGTANATVKVAFLNQAGASASVPLAGQGSKSNFSFTLEPNDVKVIAADPTKRTSQDLTVAWATISSNVALNVFSLFDLGPNPPAITGAVGAQSTPPAKSFRFPVSVGGTVGFDAGMALANPNSKTANVTVKVLKSDGSPFGSFNETLQANNQTILTLKGQSSLSFGSGLFTGSVAVCSDQPIGLVTVGFEGGQAFFSTSVTNDPCP